MASGQIVKLPAVNKQILEIKKKIQLSEGQRKALFEDCETTFKKNADEILRLKKEISRLVVCLHEDRTSTLKHRIPISQIEAVIGHAGDKTGDQCFGLIDLQIIDRNKQLDILRYKIKQKKKLLVGLANEYQEYISQKANKQFTAKVEKPIKKSTSELQNNIHAVEVQWREAEHVKAKYKEIKQTLQEDGARFASKIKDIENERCIQKIDIKKLEQVNAEASKLRGFARSALLQEERSIIAATSTRDKQCDEGRRLILERKCELESIERSFYQGKAQLREEDDEDIPLNVDMPIPISDPMIDLNQAFDVLKEATGGTGIEDVLTKIRSQKETQERLALVRKTSEAEKRKLEKTLDGLNTELEVLKYAETKDNEQNAEQLEKLNGCIIEKNKLAEDIQEQHNEVTDTSQSILERLQSIYFNVEPNDNIEEKSDVILQKLEYVIKDALKKIKELNETSEKVEEIEINEEKWLPPPYSGLVRRTPLPQSGAPTPVPPPGSDEEEEVPSRGYLKRQAQLVVDAKSRRKNLRFPVPRGK